MTSFSTAFCRGGAVILVDGYDYGALVERRERFVDRDGIWVYDHEDRICLYRVALDDEDDDSVRPERLTLAPVHNAADLINMRFTSDLAETWQTTDYPAELGDMVPSGNVLDNRFAVACALKAAGIVNDIEDVRDQLW